MYYLLCGSHKGASGHRVVWGLEQGSGEIREAGHFHTRNKNPVNKDTEISLKYLAVKLQWELWDHQSVTKTKTHSCINFIIHRIPDPTALCTNYPILSLGQEKAAHYQAWQKPQGPEGEFSTVGHTWKNETRFSASPALYTSFYYSNSGWIISGFYWDKI